MTVHINVPALETYADQQKRKIQEDRHRFLWALRCLGVEKLDAVYNGGGDEGNVEQITYTPDGIEAATATHFALLDFIWMFVYSLHPGFENNDGGCGDFNWDIVADCITVEHGDRFTDIEYTTHEDL